MSRYNRNYRNVSRFPDPRSVLERIIARLRLWRLQMGAPAFYIVAFIAVIFLISLVRVIARADLSTNLAIVLGRALGLLLGFTIHEWAHAYSAYRLGGYRALPDPGRLSLNPRVHLDVLGVVLALVAGFGWAKPVPVNPQAFYPNERRDMLTVAAAGPVTNLIIAFGFAIILRVLLAAGVMEELGFMRDGTKVVVGSSEILNFFYQVLATATFFNILLFFFNLIPLYPLDGWRVMLGLVPPHRAFEIQQYEQTALAALILIISLGIVSRDLNLIHVILAPLIRSVYELMTGFASFL